MTRLLPRTLDVDAPAAPAGALTWDEPDSEPGWRVDVDLHPRPVVVTVAGEVDLSSAGALSTLLAWLLESRPDRLVVDVRAVTFIDSTGIEPLLRAGRAARAWSGAVELRGSSRPVELLLTALGHTTAAACSRGPARSPSPRNDAA